MWLRCTFVVVLAAASVGGCLGGGDDSDAPRPTAQRPATPKEKPPELRLVEFVQLNGSGVHGAARLVFDGRRLGVESIASGATAARMHMQHIHLPAGNAEGKCPTRSLDADGDGFVSLKESVGAYGAPAVSLEPFPMPEGPEWRVQAGPRSAERLRARPRCPGGARHAGARAL